MSSSLFTALSGLRVHQQWLDVVGNNLANSNTPGFKGARAVFSSTLQRTIRHAAGPAANVGGRNPMQIGQGVQMGDISRSLQQGTLTNTGRTFDLAIEGRGYFALFDGKQRVFTRVGTFGLDAARNLVDQRTGSLVLDPTGTAITIDTDALAQPQATTTVDFTGNLTAEVSGPLAELQTGINGLAHGQKAAITSTGTGPFAVAVGSTYEMQLLVSGEAAQTVAVTDSNSDGFLTAAEIATEIDSLSGVSASVNGGGFIELLSDRTGSDITLKLNPGAITDLAALAGLSTILTTGSEGGVIPGTTGTPGATTLNDLPSNVTDYVAGDVIRITGLDWDGTPVDGSFVYGAGNDGETVDDFVAFVDSLFSGAQVSMNTDGQLEFEALATGESPMSFTITDDAATTGSTFWTDYAVAITTEGTGPDRVTSTTEVFDLLGIGHLLSITFERQDDGSWSVLPEVTDGTGQVTTPQITGLRFAADGSPQGAGNIEIGLFFNGQSSSQAIALNLGTDGGFDGLTQFGGASSVYINGQDGFPAGELAELFVDQDGTVSGLYSNGRRRDLANIGIASFSNDAGLIELGSSTWGESPNSGTGQLGMAASQAVGSIVGGSIENSNVNTAQEFVRLIEAQRGFQANARVISAVNEVLAEVANLI